MIEIVGGVELVGFTQSQFARGGMRRAAENFRARRRL